MPQFTPGLILDSHEGGKPDKLSLIKAHYFRKKMIYHIPLLGMPLFGMTQTDPQSWLLEWSIACSLYGESSHGS